LSKLLNSANKPSWKSCLVFNNYIKCAFHLISLLWLVRRSTFDFEIETSSVSQWNPHPFNHAHFWKLFSNFIYILQHLKMWKLKLIIILMVYNVIINFEWIFGVLKALTEVHFLYKALSFNALIHVNETTKDRVQ
jgi:hypothetical protein